ncbi:MAG TPA: ABC transporter permease [Gemmatimonadales bacterium]|nr:ABC transporter permease [Gemmatimonadales bacterium]
MKTGGPLTIAVGAAGSAKRRRAPVSEGTWRLQLRRFLRHRVGMAGAVLFFLFAAAALFAPLLTDHSPIEMNLAEPLTPPGTRFPLGLDSLGRDMVARTLYGARISIGVGTVVTLIAVVGGGAIGLVAGYYKGILDRSLMRVMDAFLSFPDILLAMALSVVLGMNLRSAVIALGIVYAPRCARVVRSSVLSIAETEFILAARAIGARDAVILVRHVAPNLVGPILVLGSYLFGHAIISEAALSFLGIGTQPPNPSWGLMLNDARRFIMDAFWYPLVPGAAILLAVLSINLLGDGLRDVLDPSLRDR